VRKHTRLFFLFCIPLLLIFNIGFSQEYQNTEQDTALSDDIDVFIRYHDRDMYYVGSPVIVEFRIANRGSEPYLFLTSFNKMFTFDFEILTGTNRSIPHSRKYIVETTQFEPVLNDEINLKRDEIYGARINISEWFDLTMPGEYVIRGVFYPSLNTGSPLDVKVFSSNELSLQLNPPYEEQRRQEVEIEEIRKLKAEKLPPYDVVGSMLGALQEKDFDKYFLYIRFDKFILQFSNARKLYLDAHDIDKPGIIAEFKSYLRGENRLEAIPYSEAVPSDFEVERTVVEKRDARVTVVQTFKYLGVVQKKRYIYNLHLYNDKWLVEGYTVTNMG